MTTAKSSPSVKRAVKPERPCGHCGTELQPVKMAAGKIYRCPNWHCPLYYQPQGGEVVESHA